MIWSGMMQRCTNPRNPRFRRYGARGITVSKEWYNFRAFIEDMRNRPSSEHTLDRIDNNKGYSKENCRWATYAEQNRNNAQTRFLTFHGETFCIMDWSKKLGLSFSCIVYRLKCGWALERVLCSSKVKSGRPRIG